MIHRTAIRTPDRHPQSRRFPQAAADAVSFATRHCNASTIVSQDMNVLIIGSGGREHALAWKVAQSPRVGRVFVAPGNAGTGREPGVENVPIDPLAIDDLIRFAREREVGLAIVGPEAPLVAGIVDRFSAAGLRCLGPVRSAARLEGSKAWAKAFLERHHIPTAAHAVFTDATEARAWVANRDLPLVIKADGLAAGKGVIVARTEAEADRAIADMLEDATFGEAGSRVVIEEFLCGEEASFIVLCDGEVALPMATSQDHKARDDGDCGPNTGGMGACSPAPVITDALHARVMAEVIDPTLRGLAAEGIRYTGFLYAGLMIGADGVPRVLEFNCRFGDPEAQPILMRLRSDLLELGLAAVEGRLGRMAAEWDPCSAVGVVMAAAGYPGPYRTGDRIDGLDAAAAAGTQVFHAGTTLGPDGDVVTAGGRVLCVCALGDDIGAARKHAYAGVDHIRWDGAFCRRDIGARDAGLTPS